VYLSSGHYNMPTNDETTKRSSLAPQETVSGSIAQISVRDIQKRTSLGSRLAGFLAVCMVVAGLAVWWTRSQSTAADHKPAGASRMETPPVPVVAGTVAEKDVPVFLEGLGTVVAFNTVTIHSRVDGQLRKVAFIEGQEVHAGDLLAQIDSDPYQAQVEQAMAKKGQDEAQLANARVDLRRYADLLANEGVTQQVYDTQKALVNQLEAAVKADQAAIESAKVQLAYTTIVSPIDGRTGIRLVDQGNIVHANDLTGLVVLAQLHPISVVFTLPEQTLARIQQQSAAGSDLSVLAVDRDGATVLDEGRLAVIDNQIDTATGTIKLKATFQNRDMRLWPGQFVNARLWLTTRKGSAVVPASVIQRGPEGAFAFVIKEDQTVDIRPVRVAQIEHGEALIEEGLRPGERVVVDGQFRLQKGSRVKAADAPGTGGDGKPGARSGSIGSNGDQRGSKPGGSDDGPGHGRQVPGKAKP
jgi:membrane fusion protein, multidrug efflux system